MIQNQVLLPQVCIDERSADWALSLCLEPNVETLLVEVVLVLAEHFVSALFAALLVCSKQVLIPFFRDALLFVVGAVDGLCGHRASES